MDTKQPEALRLADTLDLLAMDMKTPRMAATELRRQHAEIETLRAGYDAARLEIASLRERVQQLGQLARDVNSRRVTELEAQLAAVGAGGVGKLAVAHPTQDRAVERDELLQAAINFIQTLTGMTPPPIEVAPPEVFAPFRAFVEKIQEITDRRCAASVEPLRKRCLHQISEPAVAQAPTDADIIALADKTRTGEPGRDGYILPISFARAVLAKWGAPAPASQPVAAPAQAGEYPELPEALHCKQIGGAASPEHTGRLTLRDLYTADQMRAYVDADRIARAAFKDKI